MSIYIIAEAGVNHNGSEDLAIELIDIAYNSGADAVKFQTFKADKLVQKNALKANYQIQTTNKEETQYEMLKKLELSTSSHYKLKEHCKSRGIDFLSTAFDEESLKLLSNDLGIKTLKIPSGEITNAPLILAHARTYRDIILSTGMADLNDIRAALGVIAFGYSNQNSDLIPSSDDFHNAFLCEENQKILKEKVTILHCTSEYPAPINEVNLMAMNTIKDEFGLSVGYSDHTQGITIPIAAAALGASIIEKHFTIDSKMDGPDHLSSIEPSELDAMVSAIRDIEKSLGNGIKTPSKSEYKNIQIVRKSIIAGTIIKKGELFSAKNIKIKRPGSGISPFKYWKIIGSKANKDYEIGDLIEG